MSSENKEDEKVKPGKRPTLSPSLLDLDDK